jgi:PDDEXK-like uncharacterized protein DUF3799
MLTIQPATAWEPDKEGFFALDDQTYRSAGGLSQSVLKRAMRSPQATRRPWPKSKAMDVGILVHLLLFEPELFPSSHVVRPATYPSKDGEKRWNMNATYCKEWMEEAEKKELPVLSAEDSQTVVNAAESFASDPFGEQLMRAGHKEVAAFARDLETGLMLKARLDVLLEAKDGSIWIADAKTTADGSPDEFGKTAWRMRYAIQNAFYCHIVSLLTGLRWDDENPKVRMIYATIETEEPHLIDYHQFSQLDLVAATYEWREAAAALVEAQAQNDFVKFNTVKLPRWER